jgi:eukaryotic-like serine/threonine-protein kinase
LEKPASIPGTAAPAGRGASETETRPVCVDLGAVPSGGRALIYRIFAEALEQPDGLRAEFVAERCRGDGRLRREVESLLDIAASNPVDTVALNGVKTTDAAALIGHRVGRFRLLECIGEGGMGLVYLAERTDGVQQLVAIKLVSSTFDPAAEERFVRESQILARLEHSSIARLIDAGIEEGRAWIAIEFVRGERIDVYCARRGLATDDIVRLMIPLAAAVSVAHGLLVVHSDIKPANVLVTADGQPKLIDFGISTALRDPQLNQAPAAGVARPFSPNYAAAEQVTGGPVTVATDVFGLGALAYRLLTGQPIHRESSAAVPYMLAVTQCEVAAASRTALAADQPSAVVRALRGDLDAILSKALNGDPAQRYASAADFQSDLQRYLEGRPVSVRARSAGYRLGKFVRRNGLAVGLTALLGISLSVGGLMAWLQAQDTATARETAARRGEFLEQLLSSADPRGGRRDITVAELLDTAAATLDQRLGKEPLAEASMLGMIANTNDGLGRYAQGLAASRRQLALLEAHGGSALDTGRALLSQAELLREQGLWGEAEPVVRRAMATLSPLRADAERAQALDLLGIVLSHRHREREAETAYQQEVELESGGDEALRNREIYPYQALTGLFLDLGRYADADAYGRRALELARRTLSPDDPERIAVEAQYASVLVHLRRAAEAEPILRDVIERETRSSGAGHKDTLMFQWLLADALVELRRNAEAATLAETTARQLDALLGPENHYSLSAWQTYAVASCNEGHLEAGMDAMQRVQAVRARTLPAGDRLIAVANLGFGECLFRARRYPEAEATLLQAAGDLEKSRGSAYRRTQEAYRTLRDLYAESGRAAESARWAARVHP